MEDTSEQKQTTPTVSRMRNQDNVCSNGVATPMNCSLIKHELDPTANPLHIARDISEQVCQDRIAQLGLDFTPLHLFYCYSW